MIVFIENGNFRKRSPLSLKWKDLKIGFSENDLSTGQQYENDMKLRLKTAQNVFVQMGAQKAQS